MNIVGYYWNLGITTASESSARSIATDNVHDGVIDWSDSKVDEIDISSSDKHIAESCKDRQKQGVWYSSGRVLFPDR